MRFKKGYKKYKHKFNIGNWLKRHLKTKTSRRVTNKGWLDEDGNCNHCYLDEEGKCANCGENWTIWQNRNGIRGNSDNN